MVEKDSVEIRDKLLELKKAKGIAISRLSSHLEVKPENVFYEYMKGNLPEKGVAKDGTKFFFHGLGCSIENPNEGWGAELEFGPRGSCMAFDRFTLCHLLGRTVSECDELVSDLELEGLIEFVDQRDIDDPALSDDEKEIDSLVADRLILV